MFLGCRIWEWLKKNGLCAGSRKTVILLFPDIRNFYLRLLLKVSFCSVLFPTIDLSLKQNLAFTLLPTERPESVVTGTFGVHLPSLQGTPITDVFHGPCHSPVGGSELV